MKYYKSLALYALLSISQNCYTQVITDNDSFEGFPQHNYPPEGWHNCSDGMSTCDTEPEAFISQKASHGNTYICLVTREVGPPASVETVWAYLKYPLRKGHTYTFQLDVSLTHELWGWWENEEYTFDHPCRLEVLGINGSCDDNGQFELLYSSNVIDHYYWDLHEFSITPKIADFERIGFRAQFQGPEYIECGALLIDNFRYKEGEIKCFPNPTQGELTIELLSKMDDKADIVIYDLTGRIITRSAQEIYAGNNKLTISLEHLATGPYVLQFNPANGYSSKFNIIKIK